MKELAGMSPRPTLRALVAISQPGTSLPLQRSDGIAMSTSQKFDAHSNQLVGAMETASRKRIEPHLEPIKLKLGDVVCEAGGLLKHAYFPQGAVLSLLTVLEDGSAIETANIGREGAFGLFAAMYSRVSFNRCLVQLEGSMVRCPIELLQSEFKRGEHVRDLFVSYSETLLSQVQQTVACNAMHSTEERMCRWLLMMHDRAEGEFLAYTHEFLSHMLGANRKSVTLAAQSMQTAGLISYRRGKMQILDRPGLEEASCECYAIVRERFDAFLTPPTTAVQGNAKGRRKSGKPVKRQDMPAALETTASPRSREANSIHGEE
jgi:CRP-like cAMP-binding protein